MEKKCTVESTDMYIQEEIKKMGKVVNKLISDVNLFKEKNLLDSSSGSKRIGSW